MFGRACKSCGYCLDHLTRHVCPECGQVFDPADPGTYHSASRIAAGWILVSWLLAAVCAVWLWNLLTNVQNWMLCWWWDVTYIASPGWTFSRTSYASYAEPYTAGQIVLAAQVYVLAAWSIVAAICLRRAVARRLATRRPSWPRI